MVLNLLKLRMSKALKTKRALALQIRRDIRKFIRLQEEHLDEDQKKLLVAMNSGNVQNVDKDFKKLLADWEEGEKEDLDAEKGVAVEQTRAYDELQADYENFKAIQKELENNKQIDDKTKQSIKVIISRLNDLDTELHDELLAEVQSMKSQVKDEKHMRDFVLSKGLVYDTSKKAWHLASEVKNMNKDSRKVNEIAKDELSLLEKLDQHIGKSEEEIKEIEKDEQDLQKAVEIMVKQVEELIKDLKFLMRVFVHFHFIYDEVQQKIVSFGHKLKEEDYPKDHFDELSRLFTEAIKSNKSKSEEILNALIRMRHAAHV